MFLPVLLEMYERGLRKLHAEINLYPDEQSIWVIRGNHDLYAFASADAFELSFGAGQLSPATGGVVW